MLSDIIWCIRLAKKYNNGIRKGLGGGHLDNKYQLQLLASFYNEWG